MQFYFILYDCNRHWKLIHNKGWYSINNKICIKLIMFFFTKVEIHLYRSFNFVISNEFDLLRYLHTNIIYIQVLAYIGTNVEFECWTLYLSKCAIDHHLTILTNLSLLLNVCPTSHSNPPSIHIWLNAQSLKSLKIIKLDPLTLQIQE